MIHPGPGLPPPCHWTLGWMLLFPKRLERHRCAAPPPSKLPVRTLHSIVLVVMAHLSKRRRAHHDATNSFLAVAVGVVVVVLLLLL